MSDFPTAAQVLNHARPETVPAFTDHKIIANCEQCARERRLSDCVQDVTHSARNYRCLQCRDILVLTRKPNAGGVPVPDSGYRLGDWVFANAVDVRIEGLDVLRFPAMLNATSVDIALEKARDIDKPV